MLENPCLNESLFKFCGLFFSICYDYGHVALSQWCLVLIDKHNKCVIVCQSCFNTFCLLSPPAETIRQGFCTLLWICEVWVWSIRCGKKEDIYTWASTLCNLLTHEPNISKWMYTLFISLSHTVRVLVSISSTFFARFLSYERRLL